jgi:CheY-specific phosphatase CheX
MYRRNLDIAVAAVIAVLGGLAAAKHLPGQVTIPLGVGLFFAPGYLWSEAILTQRLPGLERTLTTLGMALIFPILGGFLFYGLHIPLFKSSWIGLLVVLTLLGVVAVAVQRLRAVPVEERQQQRPSQQAPRRNGLVLHSVVFGLAGVIAIGSVAYSVKSAEAEKFAGYTMLWMTPVVDNSAAQDIALLSNNLAAQAQAAMEEDTLQGKATQAHLGVTNHQGVPEQYELKLLRKGKVTNTWPITLNDGQSWQMTIAWSTNNYAMLADLYLLPNTTTPFHYVDNGGCVSNIKLLPTLLRAEDPCYGKTP